jgi:hypothetical protein
VLKVCAKEAQATGLSNIQRLIANADLEIVHELGSHSSARMKSGEGEI